MQALKSAGFLTSLIIAEAGAASGAGYGDVTPKWIRRLANKLLCRKEKSQIKLKYRHFSNHPVADAVSK